MPALQRGFTIAPHTLYAVEDPCRTQPQGRVVTGERRQLAGVRSLVEREDDQTELGIAGSDQRFVWADASMDGSTVLVTSPRVADPVAVRYRWADNPAVNLYNAAALPASPFRTDDWPGVTVGAR